MGDPRENWYRGSREEVMERVRPRADGRFPRGWEGRGEGRADVGIEVTVDNFTATREEVPVMTTPSSGAAGRVGSGVAAVMVVIVVAVLGW